MHPSAFASRVTLAALITATVPIIFAQAPGVPIETNHPRTGDTALLEKAAKLREAGKLLTQEQVKAQIKAPLGGAVEITPANTVSLPGREVASRARQAYLHTGWYYLCPRCEHWHLNLAGAYAVAKDVIVTCHHCINSTLEMREGYLIAIDHTGEVVPITGVITRSQTMDAALLRVEAGNFKPLPLNDQVAPGDPAYCLSEPLGQEGYFSAGIVNRFFWRTGRKGEPGSLDEVKNLRLNVSTDWAPGSSGAAVLDGAANIIGHVSTISPLREAGGASPAPKDPAKTTQPKAQNDRFNGATLITLHDAVPARAVLALAKAAASIGKGAIDKPIASYEDLKQLVLDAVARKAWKEVQELSNDLMARFPAEDKSLLADVRSQLAVATKDATLANSVAAGLTAAAGTQAEIANDVAWSFITAEGLDGLDLTAIERLARRGVELADADAEKKSAALDTLARITFRLGRSEEAIKLQQESVDRQPDDSLKERLKQTLQAYKDGKLPPAED